MPIIKFRADRNMDILDRILAGSEWPQDTTIRLINWDRDLSALLDLPSRLAADTIFPHYHATPPENDGLTLVLEVSGVVAGQISVDIEMHIGEVQRCELWLGGIFVASNSRGLGHGKRLGKAAIDIAETWRREVAIGLGAPLNGDIEVSGDTEPGSAGTAIVEYMSGLSDAMSEADFDEALTGPDLASV